MPFSSLRGIVTASLLALFALPLFAGEPVFAVEPWSGAPFTGDPKAILAAAEQIPAGEQSVILLLDESTYSFDDAGRCVSTQRIVYRIAGDSAIDSWGTINAPWAPWYQERPKIRARVITKDATVHELDESAVIEAPAPEESLDIFSDNRIIRAPLPAVAVGSVIEQLITHEQKSTLADAGISDIVTFGSWVPVRKTRVVLDAPASLDVKLVNNTAPHVEPVKTTADGKQHIVIEGGPYEPIENIEWGLPSDISPLPYVAFSTGKSWQDLAQRYSAIIDQQIGTGDSVEKLAREAIGNTKDRREAITRLLAFIQKRVRYAGVEVGESSIIPRTPQTVMTNRYGDCKDKATLLVALLRAAGYPANVALLRAGHDFDTIHGLPGLGMFNHAIVVSGDLWIDPTDEYSRAGDLPVMDQGRFALIASPKTTDLATTPVTESKTNYTVETRIFKMVEEGKATVLEITEPKGGDESSMRRFYVSSDRKKYRESVEQYAKGYYSAKALKNLDASDAHDLAKPFRLELEISEAGRGIAMDGEAAVAIPIGGVADNMPWILRRPRTDKDDDEEKKKKDLRVHDFVMPMPFVREWRYRILPASGFETRALPQNETKELASATLTKEFTKENDGTVVATIRFDSGKKRLTADEFEALRKALKTLDDEKPLVLGFDESGTAKLNAGDIAGALAEFRRLGTLHPKEGRHQVEIAKALLGGGMADAAREQIKKAIALEPTYAGAYRMQGLILEHDLFGRRFRKGCDLPGAIAAFRKAKELDSKDVPIRAELAKLLEYGDDGLLFGHGADLTGAIAEYHALIDDLEEDSFEGELLLALAHSRRFDDLKTAADKTKDTKRRDLGRIIAAAATQGSAAALREAASRDQNDRKQLLRDAAGVLMGLRFYPQAADLLEEAMQGSPSTEARTQVETVRKAKRIEEIPMPDDDPKTIVRKLLLESLLDEFTNVKAADLFASDEKKLFEKAEERPAWRISRIGILSMARDQGLPVEFYADAGIPSVQFVQEGDDTLGYRIRARAASRRSATDNDTFFVIRDNGKYRLGATSRDPQLIGWRVLRFLEANQLDAARQWLNWEREELTAGGGDDELSGPAFAKFWAKGKTSATAEEIRLAAASLMLAKEVSDESIPILVAAREKAASDEIRARIDQCLVLAYGAKDDDASALPIAQRLYTTMPDSGTAFNMLTAALTQLDRHAEAEKLANDRLVKIPRDEDALRSLAMSSMHEGKYDACEKQFRTVIEQLTPNANDYNNMAWAELLRGSELDRALEDARHAMQLPGASAALLHTLASLYAETGKSLEAREALLQSMDEAGRDEPAEHDWYVLGRIAENYGARDAALAAYKRVEKPKTTVASSTWILAERRIKAMK